MRFEVKGGGIAAIVFAMTLLSGAVFVMGLLAGYDVGRQAQLDMAQLAASYPLQSAPSSGVPSNPSSAESGNPAVQSAASATASPAAAGSMPLTTAVATGDHTLAGDSVSSKRRLSQPSATPARPRLASSSIPSEAEPPSSTAGSPTADEDINANTESENPDAGDASSAASGKPNVQASRRHASTAPSARHKPYNIQIQAAMDISGADQMMARLQKLGYPSHLVPTEIAGQRWYKVEVGPYATSEEASSAEARLRHKYDTTYGGVARDNTPAQTSADDNSEE
ncbi:MAG: SPOR domain-containing protein [Deltaproteobacteria bacterium]|nr:SPOR domain-containing protein [Deltaproteobacteria bacterium]